jgi:hypothetical protein
MGTEKEIINQVLCIWSQITLDIVPSRERYCNYAFHSSYLDTVDETGSAKMVRPSYICPRLHQSTDNLHVTEREQSFNG